MLRKAFVFMGLVLVIGAIVVVAADIRPSARTGQSIPPSTDQATLYSQMANPTGYGAAAQDFEAIYDAYDCAAADDFVVTWADGWSIEQLHAPGFYAAGGGPAAGIVYELFGNAGGLPGVSLCSGTASIISDVSGDIIAQLPAACDLTVPETYWVSMAARLDYIPGLQWYILTEASTNGNIARWINPGDGFGSGCTTWASCPISTINPVNMDMEFEILGTEIPVELQSLGVE